jgi:hypothetical protein
MTDERHDEPDVPAASSPAKQPYRAPHLIDYGSVSELTQGGGGTRSDGQSVRKFVQA